MKYIVISPLLYNNQKFSIGESIELTNDEELVNLLMSQNIIQIENENKEKGVVKSGINTK